MPGPVPVGEVARQACWACAWRCPAAYAVIHAGVAAARGEAAARRGTAASSCWNPVSSYHMALGEQQILAAAVTAGTRCSSCEANGTEGCRDGG